MILLLHQRLKGEVMWRVLILAILLSGCKAVDHNPITVQHSNGKEILTMIASASDGTLPEEAD